MSKGFILFALAIIGLLVYQRSKFTHEKFLHYSAENVRDLISSPLCSRRKTDLTSIKLERFNMCPP
jgi:hypothetical protein